MSQPKTSLVSEFDATHVSLKTYVYGFVTCVVLTLMAYFAVVSDRLSTRTTVVMVGVLAIIQCFVQLRRFLHLGAESKPRLKLIMFIVMLILVLIVVGGSLWIMDNLNYRMIHSPEQMVEYVESQDGL